MKKGCLFLILLVVAGIGAAGYWYYQRSQRPPTWVTQPVDEGEVRQTVSASGALDALTKVEVGCQISGIISSISVDFNDRVSAGQLIALIDPSTLQAQVQQAVANLEGAKASERAVAAQIQIQQANLANLGAEEKIAKANLVKAQAACNEAERNFRRLTDLASRKLVSVADLDSADTTLQSQKAGVEVATAQVAAVGFKRQALQAQIEASRADLEGARARVRQMEAQLAVAEINLSRTRIYSPIDGVVISRKVDVGQTVAASLQAPTLFTIANDLRKMMINTSVDEADIGKVREGQEVTFTVDAFRGRTFRGTVGQVRLSPTITQNVVTYAVIVNVGNDDMSLLPGMTANVEILVDRREQVTRVPTRALFFKPSAAWAPARLPSPPEAATNTAVLWRLGRGGLPHPVPVETGLANNQFTELLAGELASGDAVIVEERQETAGAGGGQPGGWPRSGGRNERSNRTGSGGRVPGVRVRLH